ncbi:methyltransferase domain-containing protein [Skermanella mucosa]|uniref:methyltransferase domain-containing protein n=1 Tax=Skermanella mucosa TaxID=1789672 RepID=UPI00192B79B8|nr:methyltransferase domain-containing protein [Skermanella mucosa]UEM21411.1 methyltransferase domain-containing protein [Skermanella mucosa]
MTAATDLSRRSTRPELMDTEEVGFEEFQHCLRDLRRINLCTLAYRPTLSWLDRVVKRTGRRRLRILDVGFGYGDMLREIHRWAGRRGVEVELSGVDLNPWSARAAGLATPPDAGIDYRVGDLFDLPEDNRTDVVISALFTHHLEDESLVRFLRWMEGRAGLGWFSNDLHRHAISHAFARAMVATLPVNRLVVHDAPLSVARAFTRADWERVITEAGFAPGDVSIEWFTPFRYGVGRIK